MRKHLAVVNLLALVLSTVVHLLPYIHLLPFNLEYVRESRPLLFLPANIALSTWLVIYIGLITYAVFQSRTASAEYVEKASYYFLFTCIGKITWTILYIYSDMWMATLALVMTLAALIMLYDRLNIRQIPKKGALYWVVNFPFSIFLGWTSVIAIVTIATALHDSGFTTSFLGVSAELWTVYLLIFLTALAAVFILLMNDYAFALTIGWGALSIFARPFDTPLYEHLQSLNFGLVDVFAFVAFMSILLFTGIHVIVRWRSNPKLGIA
jgi:hypothetical protein